MLLDDQGEFGEARGYYERALVMFQALYPKEKYPQGHPSLATSLNSLGCVLTAQGAYGEAGVYFERALAMNRRSTPSCAFRRGTPTWPLT